MQAAHYSTSSKARRSWKQRVGLPVMVLVTAVGSAIFSLLTMGAHPSSTAGPAVRADTLSLQREVQERDEAAFAASWAADRAAEQPAAGAPRQVELKVIFATECGVDCLTLMWPDGHVSTTNVTIALDYAAICGCTIVMQSRAQPTSAAINASAAYALKEQQIAEWTEYNVTQLAEQGGGLASRTSALDALDAAARQVLKDQRIAD